MWENCWYYLLHAIIKTRFYLRLAMNQDRSAIHELQRVQQQTGKDQNDQQPEKTTKQMVDNAQRCRPYHLGNQFSR